MLLPEETVSDAFTIGGVRSLSLLSGVDARAGNRQIVAGEKVSKKMDVVLDTFSGRVHEPTTRQMNQARKLFPVGAISPRPAEAIPTIS